MAIFQAPVCPDQLAASRVEEFRRDGFLAFTDVLSAPEVETAKTDLRAAFETLRARHQGGANGYGHTWSAPDGKFSIQFEPNAKRDVERDADASDLELRVRKFHSVAEVSRAMFELAHRHPKISAILEALLGAEPILSQDMALVKPPGGVAKPWHQDDAYFKVAPLDAVCGVWIALDEAGIENGCMRVWAGRHRVAMKHYHGADCEILPDRLAGADEVAVPLPPGGALFFSGLLPHHTLANASNLRRRALQFHYRARDSRLVSDDEYDAIFAEPDGTPASCAAAKRGF